MKSFIGESTHAYRCSLLNNSINRKKIKNITHMTTCNIWVLMVVKVVLQLLKM